MATQSYSIKNYKNDRPENKRVYSASETYEIESSRELESIGRRGAYTEGILLGKANEIGI